MCVMEVSFPLFPPELFILVGVNVYVALSLLTSVFDGPFSAAVPFIFQIAALAGFGQIWVNYAFLFFLEARFWCCMFYLIVALMAVVAINVYIAVVKKLLGATLAFLGILTVPITFLSYFMVSNYVNGLSLSLPWLPVVPVESLYAVLGLCIVILGLSVIVSFQPKTAEKLLKIGQNMGNAPKTHNPFLSLKDDSEKMEERR